MRELQTDVVVISGGTAGLAAAVAAAENGAGVTVFEKAATTGGTGNMAMGLYAVESKMQRMKQMALTREEAFKIHMDYTHWRADARLVKTFIDKSASTIDWLEEMGVEFTEPACHSPGFSFTWHIVKPGGSQAATAMMKALTARARELGVNILLKTPGRRLIKENGKITGVLAEDESGDEIRAKAGAVIVATGGFGDSPEWIKKYTSYEWGKDLYSHRIPGLVGDGLRMAWEAGAAKTDVNLHLIYLIPENESRGAVNIVFRQPNLMVNLKGERFVNEEIMINDTYTGNAISRQKDRCAFIIVDEAAKDYYVSNGLDNPVWFFYPELKLQDFETDLEQIQKSGCKNIFVADSLEEVAEKAGINRDNLLKTVAEYNHACDIGRDETLAKNPRYLKPIRQPRFFAGKCYPGAFGSLGGLKINYKTEVLNTDDDEIPGLYAAGVDANTIYGDSYAYLLPGNTMGFAINSGRMAGENAAKYARENH